ncbi:hypothetical protein GEA64_03625 [Photorhabdus khanii]|uniref:Uncharacterized protein n=1 Tax=Photorhabdus khanii TaxID=1004150 RepID=A0A7C9GHQ8_9GAMM|nr:hypothetical protein [Photorhabdus khanii]MQL47134.1 hypothetical protein [Photorhabdus khanii]
MPKYADSQKTSKQRSKNTSRISPSSGFSNGHLSLSKAGPQDFFLAQPHSGELKSYCGYYALSNYMGETFDLNDFRNTVYQQYLDIGLSKNEIPQLIADSGTGMEGIATGKYNFIESKDSTPGIERGKFMAATNRYGGHWLTYMRDNLGKWWEYDSWKKNPTIIGNEQKLRSQLQTDQMTNIYYAD